MEVAGDPDDFMPVFSSLDKKGQIFKDIDKAIKELKKTKLEELIFRETRFQNTTLRNMIVMPTLKWFYQRIGA